MASTSPQQRPGLPQHLWGSSTHRGAPDPNLGLLARSPKEFIPQCLSPFTALPLASPPPPGAAASVLGSLHLKGTGRWGLPGAAATPCGVPAPTPAPNPASTPAPMPGRCCSEEAARVLPRGRDFLAQAENTPGQGHRLCQNTPGKGGRRSWPREAFLPRSHTWGSSRAVGVGTTVPGGASVQIQLPTGLVRRGPGPRLCTAWPQPPGLPRRGEACPQPPSKCVLTGEPRGAGAVPPAWTRQDPTQPGLGVGQDRASTAGPQPAGLSPKRMAQHSTAQHSTARHGTAFLTARVSFHIVEKICRGSCCPQPAPSAKENSPGGQDVAAAPAVTLHSPQPSRGRQLGRLLAKPQPRGVPWDHGLPSLHPAAPQRFPAAGDRRQRAPFRIHLVLQQVFSF